MRLTLLGTGCTVVDESRYGPAHLVRSDTASVLIDCGSGVTQRLLSAGSSGRDIDAVFLTHLHSDHIIDFYQLIASSWHQGRDRPQVVYGPRGTRRYVEGLMDLWEAERSQRIEHELRPSIKALEVEIVEFSHGETFGFGDLTVSAIEVDHRPVRDAFGFVFEQGVSKLVFSGDTAPCDSLAEAARGPIFSCTRYSFIAKCRSLKVCGRKRACATSPAITRLPARSARLPGMHASTCWY